MCETSKAIRECGLAGEPRGARDGAKVAGRHGGERLGGTWDGQGKRLAWPAGEL